MIKPEICLPELTIDIPKDFVVAEKSELGKIASGMAVTNHDRVERLRIVTARYLKAGYIKPDDYALQQGGGVYTDEYEAVSVPFVSKIDERVVASLRLVRNTSGLGLDINTTENIGLEADWKDRSQGILYEWSQLAKSAQSMRIALDRRPFFALIRTCFAYQRFIGVNEGIAVIDQRVREDLNGPLTSFNLPQIGPSVEYMGSVSTPIYINIDDVIRNAADGGHRELATFLDKGKAPGYEWYQGQ